MKLWITSTVQPVQPKAVTVSRCRCSDTAVIRSDFSIENLVIGRYDGSCPTMVMSVPCSVVTTATSSPLSRSISRAIQALVACGIA